MNTYDEIVKQAFLEELRNIYAARGEDVDVTKLASDDRVRAMIKEARFLQAIRGMGQRAMGGIKSMGRGVSSGATRAYKAVSPQQRQLAKYRQLGVGDVAQQAAKAQRPSARLEQWGRQMRQTPVQRVQAAGYKLAPGEAGQITKATEQMGGTSLGKRLVGGAAEGAGGHIAHKSPLGLAINPIGVPLGGAIEGLTRQAGREAVSAGAKAGLAGRTGAARALGRVGMGAQRQAKNVGLAGEVAGLAGLGTAAHMPLSAAGALGGAMSGGAAAAAPALGDVASHAVHSLGGAGDVIAHGAHDVMGMASKRIPAALGRVPGFFAGLGSRIMGRAPQAVGAVA